MTNTIKFRKFDTDSMTYTNESYEQSLTRYVKNYSLRAEHFITMKKLQDWEKLFNLEIEPELKKPQYLDVLLTNLNEEQILTMCDNLGIGVNCYRLFDLGVNIEDYKVICSKMKVVGSEPYEENKKRNIYSLRDYFKFRDNPSEFIGNNEKQEVPESAYDGYTEED